MEKSQQIFMYGLNGRADEVAGSLESLGIAPKQIIGRGWEVMTELEKSWLKLQSRCVLYFLYEDNDGNVPFSHLVEALVDLTYKTQQVVILVDYHGMSAENKTQLEISLSSIGSHFSRVHIYEDWEEGIGWLAAELSNN